MYKNNDTIWYWWPLESQKKCFCASMLTPVRNWTKTSADADKPARRVYRSVMFIKRILNPHIMFIFPLCNSIFVSVTRIVHDIRNYKWHDLEIGVRGHSISLTLATFDWLCIVSCNCFLVTLSVNAPISKHSSYEIPQHWKCDDDRSRSWEMSQFDRTVMTS